MVIQQANMGYIMDIWIKVKSAKTEEDYKVWTDRLIAYKFQSGTTFDESDLDTNELPDSLDEQSIFYIGKWTYLTEDICDFSKKYPEEVFKIYAKGEDTEEWCEFISNGKYYVEGIKKIYPEFDQSKLE